MLKSLAVLALFVAVMQVAPQVPRNATHSHVPPTQQLNDDAKQKTAPPPVQVPAKSNPAQDTEKSNVENNKPKPTVTSESASVSRKDRWDKAYVILTGLLVAVGFIGAWLALRTLRAIERQSKANEDQLVEIRATGRLTDEMVRHAATHAQAAKDAAEAARVSADALIDSEQAWIAVTIGAMPEFNVDTNRLEILYVQPAFRNYGKTPGKITKIKARPLIVKEPETLPPEPIYEGNGLQSFDTEIDLPPGTTIQPLNIGVSNIELAEIKRSRNSTLYIIGIIEYSGVAGRQHWTRFCFIYHVPSGFNPLPEGFYISGPKAYNRAT